MNYILIDGKWILQKGKQKTPSLKDYWYINLYDDNLNHKGWGYYLKNIQ